MKKAGIVSIIGLPNAGKSTLLNSIVHKEISIATYKPNTTEEVIYGIKTKPDYQIAFLDTPGIITPHNIKQKEMLVRIKESMSISDVIVWLVDISADYKETKIVETILNYFPAKTILALNKVDLIKTAEELNSKVEFFKNIAQGIKTKILISAKSNISLPILEKIIVEMLPEQDFLFSEDTVTNKDSKFIAAEIIRKYIFLNFRKEIPYHVSVKIEVFKVRKGVLHIHAVITVDKQSQKAILIGKKGEALKQIGIKAREELERFFKKHIFLKQYVKV